MELNESNVLKTIIEITFDHNSEGVANTAWIASCMGAKHFQVRKYIKTLIENGYLIDVYRSGGWCEYSCRPYPPVRGYALTVKTKQSELYNQVKRDFETALRQAFNC